MPHGMVVHKSITATPQKQHECAVGWITHYLIGTALALLFVLLASSSWLAHPTLLPALAFGIATVLVPFFTMQPAFGLGVAASKTANPNKARLKSLMTHAVFGVGLYVWAYLLSHFQGTRVNFDPCNDIELAGPVCGKVNATTLPEPTISIRS